MSASYLFMFVWMFLASLLVSLVVNYKWQYDLGSQKSSHSAAVKMSNFIQNQSSVETLQIFEKDIHNSETLFFVDISGLWIYVMSGIWLLLSSRLVSHLA